MAEFTAQQYRDAARRALQAGDTAAAQRLIAAGRALGSAPVAPAPAAPAPEGPGFGETLLEMGRSGAAGLARGAASLADLPGAFISGSQELAARGVEALGAPQLAAGMRAASEASIFRPDLARQGAEMLTAGGSEYRSPTTAGQYAGTVGEFIPGALAGPGGVARNLALGTVAGLGSEAAGQAAQALGAGETGEAIARVGGAFFSPVALSTGNRTVNALFKRSSQAPSLETLKQTKTAAYKAADDAGVTFGPSQTTALSDRVKNVLANSDFVEDVDNQTRAALTVIERNAGKELSLSQLDKIRQRLWKRYQAAPNEVAILDLIDEIDTTIDAMPAATPLMEAARLANSRFKKAELIETAFQRAQDQAASTGSGGNVLNLYRQAVTRIINDPKKARFFSQAEIDYMRQFVRGGTAENVLRLMGKVSPSGNGLMLALNIGAMAVDPTMMAVTAGAAGAKAVSDSMSMANAARLRNALATGQIPARAASPVAADTLRLMPGLLAE
jgi:hypothetical protein